MSTFNVSACLSRIAAYLYLASLVLLCVPQNLRADDEIADRKSCLHAPRTSKSNRLQDADRPTLQKSYISSGSHFSIHYDVDGPNAVSPIDNNANGIPDYIDSTAYYAEHAYDIEITKLGYREPLRDSDDPRYWDIYIMQIGAEPGAKVDGNQSFGYYGLTFGTDYRRQPCDSNKLQCSAFMVIDNNFAITDSVHVDSVRMKRVYRDTGIVALRVTLAHEFHHMIQFACSADQSNTSFNEMTSVWMEHTVYADSQDYLQYLKPLMQSSDTRYFTDIGNGRSAGYAHAFYLQYIQESMSADVVRDVWNLIAGCVSNPIQALDSALVLHGSSLSQSWCRFMNYVYHTGYRAQGQKDALSNADSMPLLRPFNYDYVKFSSPSLLVPFSLFPYQFRLIRCTFNTDPNHASDTADVIVTCVDTKSAINGDHPYIEVTVSFSQKQTTESHRLGTTNYFYTIESNNQALICDAVMFTGGIAVKQIDSPFPQPFSLSSDVGVSFPVSESIPTDAKVQLTIASLEGTVVLSEEVVVTADPILKTRYISWKTKPQNMSSGVYLYTVSYNDNNDVGTFLVKP